MADNPSYVKPFRVEKRDYSRGKWRVLDANGEEVWTSMIFVHPQLGETIINGPVCYDRKRDAMEWIAIHAQFSPAPESFRMSGA